MFDISPSSFYSLVIPEDDVLKIPLRIEVVGDECCDKCWYWTFTWLYCVPTEAPWHHLHPIISHFLSHSVLLPSTLCFCGHAKPNVGLNLMNHEIIT